MHRNPNIYLHALGVALKLRLDRIQALLGGSLYAATEALGTSHGRSPHAWSWLHPYVRHNCDLGKPQACRQLCVQHPGIRPLPCSIPLVPGTCTIITTMVSTGHRKSMHLAALGERRRAASASAFCLALLSRSWMNFAFMKHRRLACKMHA